MHEQTSGESCILSIVSVIPLRTLHTVIVFSLDSSCLRLEVRQCVVNILESIGFHQHDLGKVTLSISRRLGEGDMVILSFNVKEIII